MTMPTPTSSPGLAGSSKSQAEVARTCSCGKEYAQGELDALPSLGTAEWPWGEVQDYRNCQCGTTMCIVLVEGEPDEQG